MSSFGYRKPADLPQTIALFPLSNALLFPRTVLSLNVFEPRYLNMVDDALAGDRLIGMIQPAAGEENNPTPALCGTGTVGRVTMFSETEDGRYLITLTGVSRFTFEREIKAGAPYRQALVSYDDFANDFIVSSGAAIDRPALVRSLKGYAALHGFQVDWNAVEQAPTEIIVNMAAQLCPFDAMAKQALLEAQTLEDRCRTLIALLEWGAPDEASERPLQ